MRKIGFDIGNTVSDRSNNHVPFDNCFEVLARLSEKHEIFIISRVNSEQRERSIKWLAENSFFEKTGINKTNLYYCFERKDKSVLARGLGLDVFVDDRIDCLFPTDTKVSKYLFRPIKSDLEIFSEAIQNYNIEVVNDWLSLESKIKDKFLKEQEMDYRRCGRIFEED